MFSGEEKNTYKTTNRLHSGFICVEGGSVGFGGKVHLLTSVGQASFLVKLAY